MLHTEYSEMSQNTGTSHQQFTDIESYRKLVQQLLQLRRYKSALFWAEKVVVFSNNNPRDVYQLAQCMFMLKEYNRATHVIRNSHLEKSNLLCLELLVECLFASKDYQEALNLLTSLDIEDLNTSLHNDTDMESSMNLSNEPNKNVSVMNWSAGQ
jgi:anaphase-promoting complex subunit 6